MVHEYSYTRDTAAGQVPQLSSTWPLVRRLPYSSGRLLRVRLHFFGNFLVIFAANLQ